MRHLFVHGEAVPVAREPVRTCAEEAVVTRWGGRVGKLGRRGAGEDTVGIDRLFLFVEREKNLRVEIVDLSLKDVA